MEIAIEEWIGLLYQQQHHQQLIHILEKTNAIVKGGCGWDTFTFFFFFFCIASNLVQIISNCHRCWFSRISWGKFVLWKCWAAPLSKITSIWVQFSTWQSLNPLDGFNFCQLLHLLTFVPLIEILLNCYKTR